MANSKADALHKAATFGKLDDAKKLIALGAPLEATDVNRWTPALNAAAHGHLDVLRLLVEAGANLHALGMRQTDLLELAAGSGNVEMVRYLLERGLPVDGHWRPPAVANATVSRIGHDSPLYRATGAAHVEIVRLLLEAGADRDRMYNGQTPLALAKERLHDPDEADKQNAYREIIQLLGGAVSTGSTSLEDIKAKITNFAATARRPEYAALHEELVKSCGEGRAWEPMPDHGVPASHVLAFTLKKVGRPRAIVALQEMARQAACHLVFAEPWLPGEAAELVLFPTADKLAVVVAVGTEGANRGVKTYPHLVNWLKGVDDENPFRLTLCHHSAVGGAFVGPVQAATKLAERIVDICPEILNDEIGDVKSLAATLKKQRSFLLCWD